MSNIQLREMFLDAEMLQKKGKLPIPEVADRPIICWTVRDSHSKRYLTAVQRKDFKPHVETKGTHTIMYFNAEKPCVEKFWETWTFLDPDMVVGFNPWYDIDYFINRSVRLAIKIPIRRMIKESFPQRKWIFGTLVFDIRVADKKLFSRTSYDLDYILRAEGIGGKKIKAKQIPHFYEQDISQVIHRNKVDDVEGLVKLDKKIGYIGHAVGKRILGGLNNLDGLFFSRILDTLLLRLAYKNDVLPSKPEGKVHKRYGGAVVIEPKIGKHENVAVLDMEKFYPSIYRTFHLSPECKDEDGDIDLGNFKTTSKKEGYITKLYNVVGKERTKLDGELALTVPGTEGYAIVFQRRQDTKDLSNAIYGFAGYRRSRLLDYDIAEKVTSLGQKAILWVIKKIREFGYEVIYGDTDCAFVKMGQTDDVARDALELANKVSETMSSFIKEELGVNIPTHELSLGVDKIFSSMAFVKKKGKTKKTAKKKYSGYIIFIGGRYVKPYLYIKGHEFVRRDSSDLTKKLQERVFHLVYKGLMEKVKYLVQRVIRFMRANKFSLEDVAINKTLHMRFEDYKIMFDFVRGSIYANKYFGANIESGSMVKMLYVTHVPGYPYTDVICFQDVEQVPKGTKVNWRKMIDRTVRSPIEEIVKLGGISFEQCLGDKNLVETFG